MRAVIDHHVDRPGVDRQQCLELTGTNRSIGLILRPGTRKSANGLGTFSTSKHLDTYLSSDDLVVMARGQTPDPIPNSAVKTLSADGTPS